MSTSVSTLGVPRRERQVGVRQSQACAWPHVVFVIPDATGHVYFIYHARATVDAPLVAARRCGDSIHPTTKAMGFLRSFC